MGVQEILTRRSSDSDSRRITTNELATSPATWVQHWIGGKKIIEDYDYEPNESEDSNDELEFNSDASVFEDREVEDGEEVLDQELAEEDAKI